MSESPTRLLLIHALGQDSHAYDFLDLPPSIQRVTVDLPGHGVRARSPMSLSEMADEIAGSVSGTIDLVGVAAGASVCQYLIAHYPGRVRSAILANSHPGSPTPQAQALERVRLVEERGMAEMVPISLRNGFTPDAIERNIPGVQYLRECMLRMDPLAYADMSRAMAHHDTTGLLRQMDVPITLVNARGDFAKGRGLVRMQEEMPNTSWVDVDGAHMVHLEEPGQISSVIQNHLRQFDS
jgi:pimeloyl-ACP methyl ester carboxylesterase